MKYVYTIASLLIVFSINAQTKTDPAELYPVFKSIKVKWDKKAEYVYEAPLNECIGGNCTDGEGTRLVMEKLELQNVDYTAKVAYRLYGMLLKGKFSEDGNHFNGKVYKVKLPVDALKKEKELRVITPLDVTDDAALKPFYYASAEMSRKAEWGLKPEQYPWERDGEVRDGSFLPTKAFPGATIHKAMYDKGSISWIDVSLPATHRFIRYTGRTFSSGDCMFGKALLDNGDMYEGFFLKHSFHGPGKLTKRSGKIQQGIWQIDSLMQDVVVQFPEALLQARLPKSTALKITAPNGWNLNGSSNFYGEVINNEASGWGLIKIERLAPEWGYGFWQHNQLEGPGIYFPSPTASQLSYQTGNKTTWENNFWITTGIYNNGKIIKGTELVTDYSVYENKEIPESGLPELRLQKILLSTSPLQGCGMQTEMFYTDDYGFKHNISSIKEGYYNDGKLSGFYFEDDKEKKRSYEFLKFAGYNPRQSFTEDIIKTVEGSNNFCFDAMNRYKPLFVAEMKNRLAANIAGEAWAKSPEGQAHKQRVEEANREYEARQKRECAAEFAKIAVKGRTYVYRGDLIIMEGYDCDKKEFIAWRPKQGNDIGSAPDMTQVRGSGVVTFSFEKLAPSVKQYETCDECNGTGKVVVTTTTTRTKELPFGYFSGIETKSIRTTTKDEIKSCSKCRGTAIVLK